MQTRNRLFDDLAKVATTAVGTVTGMKDELEQIIRQRVEVFLENINLVTREEFEVANAMIIKAREEQEQLLLRIKHLETQIKASSPKKTSKMTPTWHPKTTLEVTRVLTCVRVSPPTAAGALCACWQSPTEVGAAAERGTQARGAPEDGGGLEGEPRSRVASPLLARPPSARVLPCCSLALSWPMLMRVPRLRTWPL